MSLNRTLWQIHRWLGLGTGLLFAVVALTGVVLIWSHELNLREHRPLPSGSASPVSGELPTAIADFVAAHPGSSLVATVIPRETNTRQAWHVFLRPANSDTSLVGEFDPSHATLLGTRESESISRRWWVQLHYEFLLGTSGAIACWVVSVALVVLAISGFWIYRNVWRELFRWKTERTPRSLVARLHRWLGAWAILLALIWGITGFIYLWLIIPPRFDDARRERSATDPTVIRQVADLPGLFASAQSTWPDAEIIGVRFAAGKDGRTEVTLRTLHRSRWFWEKIGQITFDGQTGAVLRTRHPGSGTARERMLVILASLHFGSQGSRTQQVLWTLGGVVMLFLPLSGYALWLWRRGSRNSHPAISNLSQQSVVIAKTVAHEA